jgi:4-hydroxy-2-oxoheptanedioate aldolase
MTTEFGQLRQRLMNGDKIVNGFCSVPSSITAEMLARQGFDSVTIDLQHGLIDYQASLAMLQSIAPAGVPALCRVPWNDPIPVMKALDAGFEAIICPMINTREDAEAFGSYCRYAPRGVRSFGPTRAMNVFGPHYAGQANDGVVAFAMIETGAALDNLDAILSVQEIDGVYIGPADLALSLGYKPSVDVTEPEVIDAIERIRSVSRAAGKFAAIHCGSGKAAATMLAQGFDLATVSTDIRIFISALRDELRMARAEPQSAPSASAY